MTERERMSDLSREEIEGREEVRAMLLLRSPCISRAQSTLGVTHHLELVVRTHRECCPGPKEDQGRGWRPVPAPSGAGTGVNHTPPLSFSPRLQNAETTTCPSCFTRLIRGSD